MFGRHHAPNARNRASSLHLTTAFSMGRLLAVISSVPAPAREERLQAMAERSPYRGTLQTLHMPVLSIGVQARGDESSLAQFAGLTIACHGRVYDPSVSHPEDASISSAERIAHAWHRSGARCLRELDGEYSLIVHDQRSGRTVACVSLSMTRFLYWCSDANGVTFASEMRQAAVGANHRMRLDPEQIVQSLCFGGPVIDTERTEYVGISRLVAPRLYEIPSRGRAPRIAGEYWSPPPTERVSRSSRKTLPRELLSRLATAMDAVPPASACSLSGGHDSGTLWAVAHRRASRTNKLSGYGLIFPGNAADEGDAIRRLLEATSTTGTLIDASSGRPSQYMRSHISNVDRVPGGGTLYYLDIIGHRMHADGSRCHITGIGAEAWLDARIFYAADLLRQGRWLRLLVDATRFQPYSAQQFNQTKRLLRFAKEAIAPRGSRLRQWRQSPPPPWLGTRWHTLHREAEQVVAATAAREGFGRGHCWTALQRYATGSRIEAVEQLSEHYQLELWCPYLHRTIVEFGFRTPASEINAGRHPKHLLRCSARQALGTEPPWPLKKMVHDAAIETDLACLVDLGPASTWRLVDLEIHNQTQLEKMLGHSRSSGRLAGRWAAFAYTEHYLRKFGC